MTRAYQAVLTGIEADLAAGRVEIGGRLPGERILAHRYRVSRASVREAIKVLEAMGLIRTGVGSGPDAGAVVIADPAAPIGAALRWHLASRHLPVADLVGARVLIESWAVAGAARDAPVEGLVGARQLLARMDDRKLGAAEFLDLDTQFHVALTRAAGNVVVAAIMGALRDGIQSYVTEAVSRLDDWPAMADRLRAEHAGVLAAVLARQPDLAAARVAAHITGFHTDAGLG